MPYRERLSVPPAYWIITLFFGLTFVTAVGLYLGPGAAIAVAVVALVGIVVALLLIGRPEILVDAAGVRVAESLLEWPYVGDTTVLDAEATRRRLGVDAHAAAWVVQRPYIPGAVEIAVADAADPHPYWLVSSRRPTQLAAAIERARRESGAGEGA